MELFVVISVLGTIIGAVALALSLLIVGIAIVAWSGWR